jgi:tetratricopeptide (TPR) repeat protein
MSAQVATRRSAQSLKRFSPEMYKWRQSSIGRMMQQVFTAILVALLAWPTLGVGQTINSRQLEDILADARNAQQSNDLARAEACYKQAVLLRPEVAELWANLGVVQYEENKSTDAIKNLTKAGQLNPALFVPNLFLGLSYLHIEQPKLAVAYLVKAVAKNSSDLQGHLALGQAYMKTADYISAAKAYSDATRIDPQNGAAWFGLGLASLELVERDSRSFSEADRNSPYAQALLAESLARQRRYREAEDTYKAVLLRPQRPPCTHTRLGMLYLNEQKPADAKAEFLADAAPENACGLSDLAMSALPIENGANDEALEGLRKVWNRDSGTVAAFFAELRDQISRENLEAFDRFLLAQRHASLLDDSLFNALTATSGKGYIEPVPVVPASRPPVSAAAVLRDARLSDAAGHYEQCVERLKGALKTGTASELALLSRCSLFAGKFALAAQASEVWLGKMPTDPIALYWSIQANQRMAVEAFSRFESIDPDSARTHILLGDMYRQRHRYDKAQAEYGKALQQDSGNFAALYGLSWAYRLDSSLADAKTTCASALALRPEDPEANLLMGEILFSLHEYAEAEPYVRKGVESKPQMRPHAHALLGKIYAVAGRTSAAIQEMQLGLQDDEDGSLHYQLAVLYRKTGDLASFATMLRESKELSNSRDKRAEIAIGGVSTTSADGDDEP